MPAMDVMDAIYGRRSVRAYADKHLNHKLIEDLLGAAVQAPSAHNTQPWSFMLIQDRNRLESLSAEAKARLVEDFWDDPRMHPYRDLLSNEKFDIFYGAPLLVIICAEDDPIMPVEQCFLAAENLMLAAQDRGLGTCCIGWALPFLHQPEVKTELGIPEAVTPALPIIVGWPRETPEPTPRDPPRILAWLD
jgi:nitroreductase